MLVYSNLHVLGKKSARMVFVFLVVIYSHVSIAQTFTVLDDFNNGSVIDDSIFSMARWKIFSGSFVVGKKFNGQTFFGERSNSLIANGSINTLSTPFIKVCNAWELDFDPEITTSGQFDAYFFFMNNTSADPVSASGYYIGYDHKEYEVNLYRMDNGVTKDTIISYQKGSFGSKNPFRVRVTVEKGNWSLYVDEIKADGSISATGPTLRGTGEDLTYPLNTCAYQGVWINLSSSLENNDAIDNIKYVELSGCIPGAKEICGNNIDDDCDGFKDNVYRFIGDGNFSVSTNWECGVPPNPLPANNIVIIDPQANGRCNLDIEYTVSPKAKFTVAQGKELLLPTNLILQ